MTDREIVDLYWARDEMAIEQTRTKYAAYLSKTAHNILNNPEDTEETVNDTYLAAWNSMPQHRPEFLSSYLAKLTRRISIDRLRRRTAAKRLPSEYMISMDELSQDLSGSHSVEAEIDLKLLQDAIDRFLRSQKEEVQTAFIGRYFAGDPLDLISRYTGMSVGKVKSLLYRSRSSLREYLEKEGFGL